MQIIEKKLSEIKPYKNNPRKNDNAVPYVAESIREFGFKCPLVIDKDGEIVAGHTRYKAAQQLGLETVPCIIADDLTPQQIKAFRLADNKVAEKAEWDTDLLDLELGDLTDLDMGAFGFDLPEKEKPAEPEEDDYDADMARPEARTKKGDIYLLGEHRLMCGDSTDAGDVAELMGGRLADLVLTDPPYNVKYGTQSCQTNKNGTIKNDNMSADDYQNFCRDVFVNMNTHLKDGGAFYIWYANIMTFQIYSALIAAGLKPRAPLTWVKNRMILDFNDYHTQTEPCIYSWKGTHHYFTEDRTNKTLLRDDTPDFNKMTKDELVNFVTALYSSTDAIHEDNPQKSELHPTMKPVKLFGRLIKNSSKPGQIVLDLFGGSGTTLIACEQLDRVCMMMECDPHYCDVIIDRWEQYTGDKAEKIKEGKGG